MIAYIDSSVLLRILLSSPGRLPEWASIERYVTSEITRLECLRTLDRRRLELSTSADAVAEARADLDRLLDGFELVELTRAVIARASDPMPQPVKTLDAIHLSTALLWRDQGEPETVIATHDRKMASIAREFGFATIGV